MGGFVISVLVVVSVAIWVESWHRDRQRGRDAAIGAGVRNWAEANGGSPFTPDAAFLNRWRFGHEVVAAARGQVRERDVGVVSWRSEGGTGTACVVGLSASFPRLSVKPRRIRRSPKRQASRGGREFDRVFAVRKGAEHADDMLAIECRELLAGLHTRRGVSRHVRLLVDRDALMLSTDGEVDRSDAVPALVDAATTIAASIDAAHTPTA